MNWDETNNKNNVNRKISKRDIYEIEKIMINLQNFKKPMKTRY